MLAVALGFVRLREGGGDLPYSLPTTASKSNNLHMYKSSKAVTTSHQEHT